MRVILLTIFLSCCLQLFAQSELSVSFTLRDEITNVEIDSASLRVSVYGEIIWKESNYKSGDTLNLVLDQEDIVLVNAKAAGYSAFTKRFVLSNYKKMIRKNEVLNFEVPLRFEGQIVDGIDVSSNYKPEIIFSSDTLSVADFKIVDHETMILLAYPKRLQKSSELIWYRKDSIINRIELTEVSEKLIQDYRGNIYLQGEFNTFLITGKERLVLKKVDKEQLENYVLPILDTLEEDRVYFSNYNEWYPAFDYFMVSRRDTSYRTVRHIEDKEMMEQYRAEYKWADVRTKLWAWDMEAESGIDREIWVGANLFTNSIYYEKPYSPMFLVDQELIVFDHYENLLCRIDAYDCEIVDSTEIDFHKNSRRTGWERKIIQDPVTRKLYTIYDNVGYTILREIDPKTGELTGSYSLFYRYAENITVYNGRLYYIYRPFESLQKKYLYMEDLEEME